MSGPLSTNEIEDVVSSVRRLVSPEVRPRPHSRDLGLEKLILTAALQVVPEQSTADSPIAKPKATAADPMHGGTVAAPIAEPIRGDTSKSSVEAEWEAPFWTEPELALAEVALQAEDAVVVTSPEFETAAATVPEARKVSPARKSPAKKSASTRPAPASKGAEAKPKPVKAAAKPGKTAASPARAAARPELEIVRSEADLTATAPLLLVADNVIADVAAPLDLAADLRVEIATRGETTATVGATIGIEEELVVNGLAQVLTDRDGNPVSLLDEAELILMVRRVIREELQDVLGERITRNVRKLVRAEINRALTSQTLE